MVKAATASTLAAALTGSECYPHAARNVELIETHISWVFLAGPYAYKVKKPVNLGFVDFSTLAARKHYCEEEIRLNRRFVPDLYLDVVEIRGSAHAPRIAGKGAVLDYAVRMQRFPQEALADRLLARGELTPQLVKEFAAYLAQFHQSLPVLHPPELHGTPKAVLQNAMQNFEQIASLLTESSDREALDALRSWSEREFRSKNSEMQARYSAGMIRECHGDLHLGNIMALKGKLVPFDCVDFNAALRWNDVMSEVAFLVMDLMDRGAPRLASLFLSAYLEATGVYSGLSVLRWYLVYRALVRAKVLLIRARQPETTAAEASRLEHAYQGYLSLAEGCSHT
jgi:aminoglycoside phosphotransferase family enzyme